MKKIGTGHGIYKITNIVNGKFYIGSALVLVKRKADHFSKLSLNKHSNYHLQKAFNLYGKDKFIFEVLERVDDKFKLIEAEQKWLDKLMPFESTGYNICREAKSVIGRKHKPETIEKIRQANKGKKIPLEQVEKMRKTKLEQKLTMPQYLKDKLSEINKIRMTGRVVSKETREKLSLLYKGKPNLHLKGRKLSKEHIEKMKLRKGHLCKYAKQIGQYDLNNTLIRTYRSMLDASKSLIGNKNYRSNISAVCNGKQKTAYGFIWKII
jgi:group I intron endonuclease